MWSSAVPSIHQEEWFLQDKTPPSQLGFPHISRDKPLLMSTSRVKNRKPFKYKQPLKSFKRILPFFHSNHNHYLYFSCPVFYNKSFLVVYEWTEEDVLLVSAHSLCATLMSWLIQHMRSLYWCANAHGGPWHRWHSNPPAQKVTWCYLAHLRNRCMNIVSTLNSSGNIS